MKRQILATLLLIFVSFGFAGCAASFVESTSETTEGSATLPESTSASESNLAITTIAKAVIETSSGESTESVNVSTTQPPKSAAEDFAEDNGISVELAESLESVLVGMELTDKSRVGVFHYDLSDVESFKQTNDWAGGKRYQVWMAQEHIWIIYENGDAVVGIKGSNGDTFYQAESSGTMETPKTDTDSPVSDEMRLIDGQLGEYGKKDPEYPEYVDFYIPIGSYSVKNNAKNSIVMIIDNKSNDEVSRITLSSGQTGEISVESGQHIELTMYSDVSLTKK